MLSKQSQFNNSSVFQRKLSGAHRYSRASVRRVCLNDSFQDPKIQVKIPHTLIPKNPINTTRLSNKYSARDSTSKLQKFQVKYHRYFQTYKSVKVENTEEQEKMNLKIREACRELSRENGNVGEKRGGLVGDRRSFLGRKCSGVYQKGREERETERLGGGRRREAVSVEFPPNDRDSIVLLYFNDDKRGVQSEERQSRSLRLSKRRASEISINSKFVRVKETEIRRVPKARSSLKRSHSPRSNNNNSKLQQICGWNFDEQA